MKRTAITLTIGNSTLRVIPAIHYRLSFAMAIHRICADPCTRPEAIAVELGPQTAASINLWIRELRDDNIEFRVMLGLMMKNDVIRPSLQKKAIHLQKKTGRDLSEISPEILHRELDFHSEVLIPLSPTDSIIEAIRCAIRYDLPIYGIDLETVPDEERESNWLLPNRAETLSDEILANYAGYAAHLPVGESDSRREVAMAARLKSLLMMHRSLVFTCGMAHWYRIKGLLDDPAVRPARIQEPASIPDGRFERVIVSPDTAVRFLDLFPAIAFIWENYRKRGDKPWAFPNIDEIFHSIIQRAYMACFLEPVASSSPTAHQRTPFFRIRNWEKYLKNLALLNHCPIPDMSLTLSSAHETMNSDFVRALSAAFMDVPWAKQSDFPGSDLRVVSDGGKDSGTMTLIGATGSMERYVRPLKAAGPPVQLPQGLSSVNAVSEIRDNVFAPEFTWLPWDRLVVSASIRANATVHPNTALHPTEFEGDFLYGFDVKATLRSHSRGEGKLYVRERIQHDAATENKLEAFPVVWIFSQGQEDDEWTSQIFDGKHLRPHVRDRHRFDDRVGSSCMVPLIGYAHRGFCSSDPLVHYDMFSGMTIYVPTCFNNMQQALWLEHRGSRLSNGWAI